MNLFQIEDTLKEETPPYNIIPNPYMLLIEKARDLEKRSVDADLEITRNQILQKKQTANS